MRSPGERQAFNPQDASRATFRAEGPRGGGLARQ